MRLWKRSAMKTREILPPGHKETRKFRTAPVLYHKQNQEMMDSMKQVTKHVAKAANCGERVTLEQRIRKIKLRLSSGKDESEKCFKHAQGKG